MTLIGNIISYILICLSILCMIADDELDGLTFMFLVFIVLFIDDYIVPVLRRIKK